MKKILVLMLVLTMVLTLTACAVPAVSNPDGTDTVAGVAIKTGLDILETVVITILGIAGTAWAAKSKDKAYMQNIRLAVIGVLDMARVTVGELKQTVVDEMKAKSENGKLSGEQIQELQAELLAKTLEKLDVPTKNLLAAAGADICAIIAGVGEDWVRKLNGEDFPVLEIPGIVEGDSGQIDAATEAIKQAAAALKGE